MRFDITSSRVQESVQPDASPTTITVDINSGFPLWQHSKDIDTRPLVLPDQQTMARGVRDQMIWEEDKRVTVTVQDTYIYILPCMTCRAHC